MSLKAKILCILLLASAVGFNSCVNEVKNTPYRFHSDTSSVPVDTAFLHGFTKVSIFFSGAGTYDYGSYISIPDSVMDLEFSKSNSFIPTVAHWSGKVFQLSGGLDTGFSHGPDSNGLGFVSNESNGIMMQCNISQGGKQIDSGQFVQSSYNYAITTHNYILQSAKTILQYRFLPQTRISADSIVYSFSGEDLRDNIPLIIDSSLDILSTYPVPRTGIPYNKDLREILWAKLPPPILKIIFYK